MQTLYREDNEMKEEGGGGTCNQDAAKEDQCFTKINTRLKKQTD